MMLEVSHLKKSYSGRPVVNDLSFVVGTGKIVGLLGPNGAGKTTAFYMTMGLIRPDEGMVRFCGHEITHIPMHERARLGIGYLAQEPSIFREMTVEENILCVLETLQLPPKEEAARLALLLSELHLTHLGKKRAGSLSGGERRRLEITRTLITSPRCLLLDEPFANIDPVSIQELQDLMRLLVSKKGISILITDHNAREIFAVVDTSYVVYDGRVLCHGTVQELLTDPDARRIYFGESFAL